MEVDESAKTAVGQGDGDDEDADVKVEWDAWIEMGGTAWKGGDKYIGMAIVVHMVWRGTVELLLNPQLLHFSVH